MSIEIVTQFRAKPGRSDELLPLVLHLLPSDQRPEGCLDACVRQNQDDENDIVAAQCWQSRQQAERWRADPHTLTAIRALIAEPMGVRYFETVEPAVEARRSPSPRANRATLRPAPREVPKVSTPDALGG